MMRLFVSRGGDFDKKTKDRIVERSGGICECHRVPQLPTYKIGGCAQLLGPGNTFIEHIVCKELGGGNDADNGAALTKTCWRIKTTIYDQPTIAEVKRERRGHFGIDGPGKGRAPMRGGRNSGETIGFDRVPRRRLNLTQKLIRAGVIDPADLPQAGEEVC